MAHIESSSFVASNGVQHHINIFSELEEALAYLDLHEKLFINASIRFQSSMFIGIRVVSVVFAIG